MSNELKDKINDFKDGFKNEIMGRSRKWKIGAGISILVALIIIFTTFGGGTPYNLTLGTPGPDGIGEETTTFKSGHLVMAVKMGNEKSGPEVNTEKLIFVVTKSNGEVINETEVATDPTGHWAGIHYENPNMKKGKYEMKIYNAEGKLYAKKKFKVKR